jgi:ferritin-like metal-binding protein YciE
MKYNINTLEEALVVELETLYQAEGKLKEGLSKMITIIHSAKLRDVLKRYLESCDPKRTKVDRVFSYLNREPRSCHTHVVDELVNELYNRIRFAQDPVVLDHVFVSELLRISQYKASAYEASLNYVETLGLETPAALLETIVHWEKNNERELLELFFHEWREENVLL